MAIGKVNAYASVEAPKVDFGEIALNAQKFQSDHLERLKDMIPKPVKKEKTAPYKTSTITSTSGINHLDLSAVKLANDAASRRLILHKKNEEGELTPEEATELTEIDNSIQNASLALTTVSKHMEAYSKGIDKQSGASKSLASAINNWSNGQSFKLITDANGSPYYQTLQTNEDNSAAVDANGNTSVKTFRDRYGNVKDGWSYAEIVSGKAFETLPLFDTNKFSSDLAKFVSPEIKTSDNGITKIEEKFLSGENETSINAFINTTLNNTDNLRDILNQLNPTKYPDPLKKEEYTKEDYEYASKGLKAMVKGGIPLSRVVDVDLGEKRAQDKDKEEMFKPTLIPNTISRYVSPDVVENGFLVINNAKPTTNSGYSVSELEDGKIKQLPAGSTLTGVTKGIGGSSIIRVAVPTSKSSRYAQDEMANIMGKMQNGTISQTEGELQLQSVTKGIETEERYYYAPEVTTNSMLKGSRGVSSYDDVLKNVVNPQWKAKKKQGVGAKYNKN